MRRISIAAFALACVTNPGLGQHRPEGAIDWSPDGSWYPNVRTHLEIRVPTQAEANAGFARYLTNGGDIAQLGLVATELSKRLQLFACRPGYFDRQRGETWRAPGWVTCHAFFSAAADHRSLAKATLNWRWTGRRFDLEGTPAAAFASVARRTMPKSIKP